MPAFGIFTDEGMIDGPVYSRPAATVLLNMWRKRGEVCSLEIICPDHEEQIDGICEECYGEEER